MRAWARGVVGLARWALLVWLRQQQQGVTWQDAGQLLWPPRELAPLPEDVDVGSEVDLDLLWWVWDRLLRRGRATVEHLVTAAGRDVESVREVVDAMVGAGLLGVRWGRASGVGSDGVLAGLAALGEGAEQVWGVVGDGVLTAGQVGRLLGRPEPEAVGSLEALEGEGLLTRWYAVSSDVSERWPVAGWGIG